MDLYAIGAGILVVLVAIFSAFRKGRQAEQGKQAEADVKAVEKVKEVQREVENDSDHVDALRRDWLRDDDR